MIVVKVGVGYGGGGGGGGGRRGNESENRQKTGREGMNSAGASAMLVFTPIIMLHGR